MDEQQQTPADILLNQAYEALQKQQHEHLEAFAAAYLLMTNIPPQDAVLVQQRSDDGMTIRWWFERKGVHDA